ncbi:MAG: hypothetical protein LBQ86_02415 [Holophagales bacterium]|jgi:hypothetical protein|nr:hypothetical protein [Holophagales bacterium]
MKYTSLLFLPLSVALAAQTTTPPAPSGQSAAADNKALKESEELRNLREAFSQVLDAANASWFGKPYQQIKAVDLRGNLAIVLKGSAIDARIEQATQGAVRSAGVKNGEARCKLQGTYFANGDHLYDVTGDMGEMRFQRTGEKGYWYIKDQNAYTTNITLAPSDAPVSFMGWFASVMIDIKEVYVNGPTFKVSSGKGATIGGKAAKSVVFNAPTAPYDPKKREQAASETFSFWKKGRLEVFYDESTKQPLRMEFANAAQGIEATMSFEYDSNRRVRRVNINNKSKQWEGPGFVSATYNGEGAMTSIAGELTGSTHKVSFDLATTWSADKSQSSIQPAFPQLLTASKLGREDMELRMAMMFAGNIGDMQRAGFNVMAPKIK